MMTKVYQRVPSTTTDKVVVVVMVVLNVMVWGVIVPLATYMAGR
jgi:hypothetical protein